MALIKTDPKIAAKHNDKKGFKFFFYKKRKKQKKKMLISNQAGNFSVAAH